MVEKKFESLLCFPSRLSELALQVQLQLIVSTNMYFKIYEKKKKNKKRKRRRKEEQEE